MVHALTSALKPELEPVLETKKIERAYESFIINYRKIAIEDKSETVAYSALKEIINKEPNKKEKALEYDLYINSLYEISIKSKHISVRLKAVEELYILKEDGLLENIALDKKQDPIIGRTIVNLAFGSVDILYNKSLLAKLGAKTGIGTRGIGITGDKRWVRSLHMVALKSHDKDTADLAFNRLKDLFKYSELRKEITPFLGDLAESAYFERIRNEARALTSA